MMDSKPSSIGAAKRHPEEENEGAGHSDSDSGDNNTGGPGEEGQENPEDETGRLRREKRLAMNRESARARRKRKKILIDTLEHQVAELTKSNHNYRVRVADLEKELLVAKQTIQALTSGASGAQTQHLGYGGGMLAGGGPGHIAHALGAGRLPEHDPNETLRRVLQAQNNPMGLPSSASQVQAVAGLGLPQTSLGSQQSPNTARATASGVLPLSPPLDGSSARFGLPSAVSSVDPLAPSLEGVASRLGISAGAQSAFAAGRPTSVDEALARERLLLLQQQQNQQQAAAVAATGASVSDQNDAAARALLLQQILQEQELAAQKQQAASRAA